MSAWTRKMRGWYVSAANPRLEVKTYCDCGRNCSMAWAVYVDDEVYQWMYANTRAEATAMAERALQEVAA